MKKGTSLGLVVLALLLLTVWLETSAEGDAERTTPRPSSREAGPEVGRAGGGLADSEPRQVVTLGTDPEPSPNEQETPDMDPGTAAQEYKRPRREQLPDSQFEGVYQGWTYEDLNQRCAELLEKVQADQARLLEERYQAGLYTVISPKTVVTGGGEVIGTRSDWIDEVGGEKQYSAIYLPAEDYPEFYALLDEWGWLMRTTTKMGNERVENVVDVRDL